MKKYLVRVEYLPTGEIDSLETASYKEAAEFADFYGNEAGYRTIIKDNGRVIWDNNCGTTTVCKLPIEA